MIAIAIAGVLAAVAVPNLTVFSQNNRLSGASNDLLRSFQIARSEAIKRQVPVTVCATANPSPAVPTCSYGTFKTGWIVFQDSQTPAWQTISSSQIIEKHAAVDATVSVKSDTGRDAIEIYNTTGFIFPDGTKKGTRNIVLCDVRGTALSNGSSLARALIVAPTGRSRVSKTNADLNTAVTGAVALVGGCP